MKIDLDLSKIDHKDFLSKFSDSSWKVTKKEGFNRIHPDRISSNHYYTFEVTDYLDRCRKERTKK